MNENDPSPVVVPPPRRRRPPLWILLLVVATVLVPFLFWRATWFGRSLSDREMGEYLADTAHPRHMQHALVQIGDRIVRGDATVQRWYPQVVSLAHHPSSAIRATAAWVMGQDNHSAEFHRALAGLLSDPNPLVRGNAALSLVRFGDASARPELRRMLEPYAVTAPVAGRLTIRVQEGEAVNVDTLLARIATGAEKPTELRAPLPGEVPRWLVKDGATLQADEPVVLLAPSSDQVWEVLRALYLVGQPEDLDEIRPYAAGRRDMPNKVREQAILTEEAIRQRAEGGKKEPPSGSGPD